MSGLWHIHCMFFHVGDTRKGAFTTILIFKWKLYSYILSLLQCIEWHGRRGGENLKAGDKLSDSAWPPRTSLNTTACPLSNILDIQVYPAFRTKFKRWTFLWERCWTDRKITGAGTQCTCKLCIAKSAWVRAGDTWESRDGQWRTLGSDLKHFPFSKTSWILLWNAILVLFWWKWQ